MKYMGSKAQIANSLLPILVKNRVHGQWYVEPFAGGMNMICRVAGNRIANDVHLPLIRMWEKLVAGWVPEKLSKEEYYDIRGNRSKYPPHIVGWAGFSCSYAGKYFDGYANENNNRDYQDESLANIMAQVQFMRGVVFKCGSYDELEIPPNSIVYCDPPYLGARGYFREFDHKKFWNWVRDKSNEGHEVFVSEYYAPSDFECLWQKEQTSTLSRAKVVSTEKLFKLKGT